MDGKKAKKRIGALTVALLTLGILVVVNLFALRHFNRLDLTEEKQYTLSDSSISAVRGLEDTLTVTVYVSENIPANLMELKRGVIDTLEEFRSYSAGRMILKYVNPEGDDELKQKLARLGIQEAMWRVIEKDKVETAKGYFGIGIRYRDKEEGIPVVGRLDTFEYTLTATILKVAAPEAITIGFLMGHEEYEPYVELNNIWNTLQSQYEVTVVNLDNQAQVPGHVDVLVIPRPKEEIAEYQKFAIDQFMLGGGRVVMLIDPIELQKGTLRAEPIDTGLGDMLESYGLTLNSNLVLDRHNQTAQFNMGRGMFMNTPYPFWVKVIQQNMDRDNPALTNINQVLLPWATWIDIAEELPDGLEAKTILASSEFSWTQPAYNLSPQQQFQPGQDDLKSRPMAVLLTGTFPSHYEGEDIPEKETEAADPAQQQAPQVAFPGEKRIEEATEEGALLVIGNASFLTGSFARMSPTNQLFFLNAVDQMAYGDRLISLRARGMKPRTIDKEVRENEQLKNKIKWINFLLMPGLVIVFGIFRSVLRRNRKGLDV